MSLRSLPCPNMTLPRLPSTHAAAYFGTFSVIAKPSPTMVA